MTERGGRRRSADRERRRSDGGRQRATELGRRTTESDGARTEDDTERRSSDGGRRSADENDGGTEDGGWKGRAESERDKGKIKNINCLRYLPASSSSFLTAISGYVPTQVRSRIILPLPIPFPSSFFRSLHPLFPLFFLSPSPPPHPSSPSLSITSFLSSPFSFPLEYITS